MQLLTVQPIAGPVSPGTGRHFRIAARSLENGDVLAYCTTLPGAHAQESDVETAIRSLRAVLDEMVLEYQRDGSAVPHEVVPMEDGDRIVATFAMNA